MGSTSVRVDDGLRDALKSTASQTGQSIADVIRHALELYRAELFYDEVDAAYARLQDDADAWDQELGERRLSENALMDDLEDDEWAG